MMTMNGRRPMWVTALFMWMPVACLALSLAGCANALLSPRGVYLQRLNVTSLPIKAREAEDRKFTAMTAAQQADIAAIWDPFGVASLQVSTTGVVTPRANLKDPRVCAQVPAACTSNPATLSLDQTIKVATILWPERWLGYGVGQALSEASKAMSSLSSLSSLIPHFDQSTLATAQAQSSLSLQAQPVPPAQDKALAAPELNGTVAQQAYSGSPAPVGTKQQFDKACTHCGNAQ